VTAWIAPPAEHNLTIHPAPGEKFFWWHTAPGLIDSVAAWIRYTTDPWSRGRGALASCAIHACFRYVAITTADKHHNLGQHDRVTARGRL
jgi:hypothetical protein